MNTIRTSIFFILFSPLFFIWLLFNAILAFLGVFLFFKKSPIDLDKVQKKETICAILHHKGLLSDQEYAFETNDVANQYAIILLVVSFLLIVVLNLLLRNNRSYFA